MDVAIKFVGGLATTENLTGSCTVVEVRLGKKAIMFLVDSGLVQGDHKHFMAKNQEILRSVSPKIIDYVILTHAHIDHVGLLPLLVNKGFRGKVICTEQTADLLPIMLSDSYKVQKEIISRMNRRQMPNRPTNKKNTRKCIKRPPKISPLFTDKNVKTAIALIQCNGFPYKTPIKLAHDVILKFYPSGHILGGAICAFELFDVKRQKTFRLGFSGDLGRQESILLNPPEIIEEPLDLWFTESTYGDRVHPERSPEIEKLYELLTSAKDSSKKVIIPSFALERSQEIIYLLTVAMDNGRIPIMPIYLDSPMAIKITGVFAKYWNLGLFNNPSKLAFNPFGNENPYLRFVSDEAESIRLANKSGLMIIIASAGMCDGGRVQEHLRVGLSNPQTIICLVGYMIQASTGGKLKSGLKTVKVRGEDIIVRATIEIFKSFSAHGDCQELIQYAKAVIGNMPSEQLIGILHGERNSGLALKEQLDAAFAGQGVRVFIPPEKYEEKIII